MPIAARAKMSTRLLLLAAAGLAAVGLSACDATSGPTGSADNETRKVTVVGAGEVQGTPDTLTVNASIEFVAPDVSGAMNQTSDRQKAVIDALVGVGIDRKDISTTQVSLQPQFAGGDSTTIIGYRASNSIDVKIRKLDTASQALALIISTGGDATRINSVNYAIDDDSQLVKDARARAFNDAKDRAQQYAQLSGLDLGKVVSISESAGPTPPTPLPNLKGAEMAAVPVEPGQQTVGFSVTVIFELT
ncbi:MAG TPA: SIMPL domain-containing protein [Mycobacterium sp.]|nr:SIMPL domain-containing protein [Mycobacterium sp.]